MVEANSDRNTRVKQEERKDASSTLSWIAVIFVLLVFVIWGIINVVQDRATIWPIVFVSFMLVINLLWFKFGRLLRSRSRIFGEIDNYLQVTPTSLVVYSIILCIALVIHSFNYNRIMVQLTMLPSIETPIELLKKGISVNRAKLIEGAEYVRYDGLRPQMDVLVKNVGKIKEALLYVGLEGHTEGRNCSDWCEIGDSIITIRPTNDLPPEIHWAWLEIVGVKGQKGSRNWAFMPTMYVDFSLQVTDYEQDPPDRWTYLHNEVVGEVHNRLVLPAFLKLCDNWPSKRIIIETDCFLENIDKQTVGGIGFYLPGGYSCIFRDGSAERVTIRRWGYGRKPEATSVFSPGFRDGYRYILKAKKCNGDIECFVWDNRVSRWHDYNPVEGDPGVAIGVWNTRGHFRWVRIYCPPIWER